MGRRPFVPWALLLLAVGPGLPRAAPADPAIDAQPERTGAARLESGACAAREGGDAQAAGPPRAAEGSCPAEPSLRAGAIEAQGDLLRRMALTFRRPSYLRWATADDSPANRRRQEYAMPWRVLPVNVRPLPAMTPDAERWGLAQQIWMATATYCTCPPVGGGGPGPPDPGRVPDGDDIAGAQLLLHPSVAVPGHLVLNWGASCSGEADDYSVHQGNIGEWYSHTQADCTTAGALSTTLQPRPGDHYYLVVPHDGQAEGSYGVDSAGLDRPVSATPCRASHVNETCP